MLGASVLADHGAAPPSIQTALPVIPRQAESDPSVFMERMGGHACADPWAHRRGEPRVFAFLWTMYVLLAVAGSILWVSRFASVTAGTYGPAARIMLVVVAVGATILWPMVRLSQASPRRGAVSHVLADALIVLMPSQLVLWPLYVLANWPLNIVAGVAGVLAAWIVLVGGVLALALGGRAATEPGDAALTGRTIWMGVILALVCAAPAAMLVAGAGRHAVPGWLPMLSPLSAIPRLTGAGLAGPQNPVTAIQWELIGGVGGAGFVLWFVAFVRSVLGGRREQA